MVCAFWICLQSITPNKFFWAFWSRTKGGLFTFSRQIVILVTLLCFRRRALQRRAQEAQVSNEEQEQMLRSLERKETEYMRLQRHKIRIDDFEQLTIIGKGAFGEVMKTIVVNNLWFRMKFQIINKNFVIYGMEWEIAYPKRGIKWLIAALTYLTFLLATPYNW